MPRREPLTFAQPQTCTKFQLQFPPLFLMWKMFNSTRQVMRYVYMRMCTLWLDYLMQEEFKDRNTKNKRQSRKTLVGWVGQTHTSGAESFNTCSVRLKVRVHLKPYGYVTVHSSVTQTETTATQKRNKSAPCAQQVSVKSCNGKLFLLHLHKL